jgi:hypothetical protein
MPDPTPSDCGVSGPAAKRRRFFQIHLSTAVVLMFVAGALVWANIVARPSPESFGVETFWTQNGAQYYGWPLQAYVSWATKHIADPATDRVVFNPPHWSIVAVLVNALAAVVVITVTAICTECVVLRRRERQQP